MAYIRVNKQENPYVSVHKDFAENPNLSWAAKGLMMYILSRPDDWKINQTDLVKRAACGESVVRKALWNLMEQGYIYYYAERENGKIKEWVYEVYEHPDFNPHKEEAQKIAREKIETKKKKQKERNDLKKVNKSPERDNHVVEEKDKKPERSNSVLGNSEQGNRSYNKNDLNKNDLNKNNNNNNTHQSKPKKKTNTYNKRTRTEIVPEWIKDKDKPKQEEQSLEFLERKARLQARLKEKYKKKKA